MATPESPYRGEYLRIKTEDSELQVRVNEDSLQKALSLVSGDGSLVVESFSLGLEPNSGNGTIVARMDCQEIRSGVANGTVFRLRLPLTRINFNSYPIENYGGARAWIVSVESDESQDELIFEEPVVVVGSPTNPKQNGRVILENGQLMKDIRARL